MTGGRDDNSKGQAEVVSLSRFASVRGQDRRRAVSGGAPEAPLPYVSDGMIQFDGQGGISVSGDAPTVAPADRDWTNQELADLTRVKRLLSMAGIAVETDRGLTDEGDPWYVFLDAQGEVFVHLCRIDGYYIIDSPAQDRPVSGVRFDELVDRFARRAYTVAQKRAGEDLTVLRFQRGGNVRLHPGAALAALVFTIFLEHEGDSFGSGIEPELSMDAPDADGSTGGDAALPLADQALPVEFAALFESSQAARTFLFGDAGKADDLRGQAGADRIDGGAVHQSVAGLGLTALAMAFGLRWSANDAEIEYTSDELSPDWRLPSAEGSDAAAGTDHAADAARKTVEHAEVEVADADLAPDAADHRAEADAAGAAPDTAEGTTTGVADELLHRAGLAADTVDAGADTLPDEIVTEVEGDAVAEARPDAPASGAEIADETAAITEILQNAGIAGLIDSPLQTYSLGDVVLTASFDLGGTDGDWQAALDTIIGGPVSTTPVEESDPVQLLLNDPESFAPILGAYNEDARLFVTYLLSKNDGVEVVAMDDRLILIDSAALETEMSETYSMSWSIGESGTISTIGVLSDFAAFDLVA